MSDTKITNYKAYVSLLGAILTALVGSGVIPVASPVQPWLTGALVIVTAVGTWLAPYEKTA